MPRAKTPNTGTSPAGLQPGDRTGAVFDRATRLASALFGQAQAQVVLVGDGVVWRSRDAIAPSGHDVPASGIVIAGGELLWVEDGRVDPRFADNAIVAGPPFVRFYAGAPIRLQDGSIPGVLCVVGLEPRPFDAELAARLQDLADFLADEWVRLHADRAREVSTRERDAAHRALAGLISTAPIPLVIVDRAYRVLDASPRWREVRAPHVADVRGRDLFELAPEAFEPFRPALARALAGETLSVDRLNVPRRDGGSDWLQVVVAPWRVADGEIGGIIITSHDITGVMEALERAERSEERLKLALEIAEVHVWEVDFVRRELIKAGAEDTFFAEPKTYEEMAHDVWDTIHPEDRPAAQAAWDAHIQRGGHYAPEYRINRDDATVWAASTARLISDPSGRPLRLVGAIQNITERKAQECALVRAKEQAEAANQAKSAFLATMSHEIRTPLNGVLGMAQAMAAGDLTPTQREKLEVIRRSGESLLAILNDVLDLSKIEAGKLELEQAEFDIVELARGAHATFEAVAEAKDLLFELKIEPAARGVYVGDSVRVRQILYNLVSNALKFTERGGVTVTVSRRRDRLKLRVRDTGIGIPGDKLAHLFRKFEQADASTTRRYGGTGLGLAICRDLTELMGGTITAESRAGEGAVFTVDLPLPKVSGGDLRAAETAQAAAAAGVDDRAIRILAAEDNATNQLVLKTLLAQLGLEPVIVGNGREALDAWDRERWDLILMDVQMPVMDGPTAARAIRTREVLEGRPRTPILALTANTMNHHIDEYLAVGMDGFIPKPIEAGRLIEALNQALQAAGDAPAAEDAVA
jgi:PAS domain S-box-containing protein